MVLRGDAGSFVSSSKWDLPEEEGKRLIYYFLSECCINTMQALYDVVGPEETSQLWRPYNTLASRAYVLNRFQDNRFPRLLDNNDPLLTIGIFVQHYFRTILAGRCENMVIFDKSLAFSVYDWQPPDMPPGMLSGDNLGFTELLDPRYEILYQRKISKETREILGLVKRKDDAVTTFGSEGTPRLCVLPLKIEPEEVDFWRRHFWGEFWRQASSVLIEEFGVERASKIVEPYMRQIGFSMAIISRIGLNSRSGTRKRLARSSRCSIGC